MISPGLKTYSHLQESKRVPSEYEIGSTHLHYYPFRGVEVETPVGDWVKRQHAHSAVKCGSWSTFNDPRATTYASYTNLQHSKEAFVAKLNEMPDRDLSEELRLEFARMSGCLRFVFHTLQMSVAYVGQMSPSSKLTIACAFQAGDEMRKVHQFSYRLARWRETDAAEFAMAEWMKAEAWQPMRKLMEELLVTYDWSETFIALNRAIKPAIDQLLQKFAAYSSTAKQHRFAEVLGSLLEDSEWHQSWSEKLEEMLTAADPENPAVIETLKSKWTKPALVAVESVVMSWKTAEDER